MNCRWRLRSWSRRRGESNQGNAKSRFCRLRRRCCTCGRSSARNGKCWRGLRAASSNSSARIWCRIIAMFMTVCSIFRNWRRLYTDSLTGILQVYLNMSSNQTGEVVKLLTLITVITTPLMIVSDVVRHEF